MLPNQDPWTYDPVGASLMPSSGIRRIYDTPVGSHLCAFYQTSDLLLEFWAVTIVVMSRRH